MFKVNNKDVNVGRERISDRGQWYETRENSLMFVNGRKDPIIRSDYHRVDHAVWTLA